MGDEHKPGGSEDVRVVNIGAMIAQMLELKRGLVELAELVYWAADACPIVTAGYDHMDISKMLTGLECWTWECPFCGQNFQD